MRLSVVYLGQMLEKGGGWYNRVFVRNNVYRRMAHRIVPKDMLILSFPPAKPQVLEVGHILIGSQARPLLLRREGTGKKCTQAVSHRNAII